MTETFLSQISIHDFRTFGDFHINVPAAPGLVLITGSNGLGKSSFFDAIEWALTGKVRRFEPYLGKSRKKLLEGDYLTRRGAEIGTHQVSLTFSDGEPIIRGPENTTPKKDIIARLTRPDGRAVNDLGTYLALTHFLGQAAQQRFTSREPQDQWKALKGPSGIERLEKIRNGLRGRSTITAFTRRIDSEKLIATQLEKQIAEWQGWMNRLDRLMSAVRATGAFAADEIANRLDRLESEIYALTRRSVVVATNEPSSRLAELRKSIDVAHRSLVEEKTRTTSMVDIPGQYAVFVAGADVENLARPLKEYSDAEVRLNLAKTAKEEAERAFSEQQSVITLLEQNVANNEAGRSDMIRRDELAGLIAAASAEQRGVSDAVLKQRELVLAYELEIKQHTDAKAVVARLRSDIASAKRLHESLQEYLKLESDAGAAYFMLEAAQSTADVASAKLVSLEAQASSLKDEVTNATQAKIESDRHAAALNVALSQIANHIHSDDTECPVCQTKFEPGVIKSLAEAAAVIRDEKLARADELLEQLISRQTELNGQISALRKEVAAPIGLLIVSDAALKAALDARAAIARTLGIPEDGDLVGHSAKKLHDLSEGAAAAEAAIVQSAADAAVAHELRSSANEELSELVARLSQTNIRLSELKAQHVACIDRIAGRNLSSVSVAELDARLTSDRQRLEPAREKALELTNFAASCTFEVQKEQAAVHESRTVLTKAEAGRKVADEGAQQLRRRWVENGMGDNVTQIEYEHKRSQIEDKLVTLSSLNEQQLVLARQNEDSLIQHEIDEVLASMRAAAGEKDYVEPAKHLLVLKARYDEARAKATFTTGARAAVKVYSEALQQQADDFARRVLEPLNEVIDDFNEAMLSTPGESIQFKADTRVDATTFGMALRYREKVRDAIEGQKDLPPQIVLSEGQLAANGFSILCAANSAYQWSTWQAMLLDDPLQHNDIIHTAAFVDVMRNLVELKGYQLIMSSHDRSESDFIARKFDAANLPCSTVQLNAPSERGVIFYPPEYNYAATRVMREKEAEHLSNIA